MQEHQQRDPALMDVSAYPQALIDRMAEAPVDQLQAFIAKRFDARGPINRMTYAEVFGITALCRHCGLASDFSMMVLDIIESDLVAFEGLTPEQVQKVKNDFDVDTSLKKFAQA